ncbi:alpha/beta hydrolase [uncultured Paraglaciecola sp.]|uniref:alpha/beta hydrolase n=1 Tax=uncultured Paraglaciecola sp. TaxID=1765024 RepID=UPI0030DA6D95|tara:strand:- start:33462 stop:34325 length:864 start_codon:yes stop_codon:yes gene_type:complete
MQTQIIENLTLYSGNIPGAKEAVNNESVESQDATGRFIIEVSQPQLTAYWPDENLRNGCAVVICPGGGYRGLSIDKEGEAIALRLVKLGISAFVLKYRMPADRTMETRQWGPLQDVQQALHVVKSHATEWQLDLSKIGVMGFSAGGHVASSAAVHYQDPVLTTLSPAMVKPAFQILIYPVISMDSKITHGGSKASLIGEDASPKDIEYFSNDKQVNSDSPRAFIMHANDDINVPVENSLRYYRALMAAQVPVQLLLLPDGGHGFGMYHDYDWFQSLVMWLKVNQLVS